MLVHENARYRTELLPGWRGRLIRWLLRSLVRAGKASAEPEPVAQPPKLLEIFEAGSRQMFDPPVAPAGPVDRYEQAITPEPIPFLALQDRRAAKYVYTARRRFASPDGDFDAVPAGTVAEPISTRDRR